MFHVSGSCSDLESSHDASQLRLSMGIEDVQSKSAPTCFIFSSTAMGVFVEVSPGFMWLKDAVIINRSRPWGCELVWKMEVGETKALALAAPSASRIYRPSYNGCPSICMLIE